MSVQPEEPAALHARIADEVRRLVAVPSVNPRTADGVAVAGLDGGETAVAHVVAEMLGAIPGVQVSVDEFTPGRANVVARLGAGDRRAVLLETHLDTVEPADHATPFAPVVVDGEVRGRGACDAKGQIIAQLEALRELAADADRLDVDVVVAFVADEEHLFAGVRRLLDTPALDRVECAFVGEPTELRAVVSHKGVVRGDILCHGIAAHSSRPDQGVNAVELAAEVTTWLREAATRLPVDELVGRATMTVTGIRGGDGANVVPAECTVSIDRRTIPGEDAAEVWSALGTELAIRFGAAVETGPPRVLDPALPRVGAGALAAALGAAAEAHGLDGSPLGVSYGTDASKIAARGIETIVFGPGRIEDAHTANETVSVADILTAAAVMADGIRRL